jgi:hypothetical protein
MKMTLLSHSTADRMVKNVSSPSTSARGATCLLPLRLWAVSCKRKGWKRECRGEAGMVILDEEEGEERRGTGWE